VRGVNFGALEALLQFLREDTKPIPVSAIGIGKIHKRCDKRSLS
jgi:hypothetical protein